MSQAHRRTPETRRPARARLTAREHDVMLALARGLDTASIGEELHLSPGTVRNYLSQLYQKIGVSTRVQALLWWSEQAAER